MNEIDIEIDQELIDFANVFSKNYRETEPSNNFSSSNKYNIEYLDKILGVNGEHLTTIARIGKVGKIMELDKSLLLNEKYTSDFVFYLILWCYIYLEINNLDLDFTTKHLMSDIKAFGHCKSLGKNIKNVYLGAMELFQTVDTPLNIERAENLTRLVKIK